MKQSGFYQHFSEAGITLRCNGNGHERSRLLVPLENGSFGKYSHACSRVSMIRTTRTRRLRIGCPLLRPRNHRHRFFRSLDRYVTSHWINASLYRYNSCGWHDCEARASLSPGGVSEIQRKVSFIRLSCR